MKITLPIIIIAAASIGASQAAVSYGFNFTRNNDGFVNLQSSGVPRASTTAHGTDLWTDSGTIGALPLPRPTSGTKAMVGGLTVTWSSGGTWANGSPNSEPGDQSATVYKDYLDDGGGGVIVTISGMSSLSSIYDLTVFQNSDNATLFGSAAVTETSGGGSLGSIGTDVTRSPAGPLRGSATLEDLTDDSITLTFPTRSGTQRSSLSAFIITIPEPASTALLGLGSMVFMLRRRRA